MNDIDIFAKTTSCVEIKNDVGREIDFEIMKMMKAANDSLAEELAKYKRAFEIFKDYNNLPPLEDFRYSEPTNCYFCEIDEWDEYNETYRTIHYVLEKNEYELLEELMSDAKD